MKRILAFLIVILMLSGQALAQEGKEPPKAKAPESPVAGRVRTFILGVGLGYMNDPDMGHGMISLDYYVTNEISVGPYFYFGGSGNNSYWAFAGQVKFCGTLVGHPDIHPYAFVGVGFIEPDFAKNSGDTQMTYLFPAGIGIEFDLTDIIFLYGESTFMLTEEPFSGLTIGIRILL